MGEGETAEVRFPCPGPWASGPGEVLEFGVELLRGESDRDRRLGMILIDNAVELTLKVYAGLPARVLGVQVPARRLEEMRRSFPRMLDGYAEVLPGALPEELVSDIDWYHRLRNQLYHEGNGLTVERAKAVAYAEIAAMLHRRLFGGDVGERPGPPTPQTGAAGAYLSLFLTMRPLLDHIRDPALRARVAEARATRNAVAHGERVATPADVLALRALRAALEEHREAYI